MAAKLRRVIVTRPKQQAQSWIDRLVQANIDYAYVPVLAIVPLKDLRAQQTIKNVIVDLDRYHYLIFVSQNAVKYGFDWIEDFWPQFPQSVNCLSIGNKTHKAVLERLQHYSIIHKQDDLAMMRMDSEELLAAASLQDVAGKKILIFRGQGGRTKLNEELSKRGADVRYCELYRRELPAEALPMLKKQKIHPDHDILPVFSGESLENIHKLLLASEVECWQNLPLLVPSVRVKTCAQELGFTQVSTAINASEEVMWQVLQALLQK